MAEPQPYEIQYNFAGFQASNPSTPLPAPALDNELENIELALGETQEALSQLRATMAQPFPPPTKWLTATTYSVDSTVFYGPKLYICIADHVSTVFATDLANHYWEEIADFTPSDIVDADDVIYDNSASGLAADHAGPAIDELAADIVTLAALPVGRADLSPDVLASLVPVGVLAPYAGAIAPAGWLLCDGSAVARSIYVNLFLAIGTAYGAGDGSTTFNVPDLRGRIAAGRDDMGGPAAGRLALGPALGAAGGAQSHTLVAAELAAHTHSASAATVADHGHPVQYVNVEDDDPDSTGLTGGIFITSSDNVTKPAWAGVPGAASYRQIGGGGAHGHTVTVASAGSSGAHNNLQPTIIANYIISTGVVA